MATRDRSQGIGFAYVDLKQALAQREALSVSEEGPIPTANAKSVSFNRDSLFPAREEKAAAEATPVAVESQQSREPRAPRTPVEQIRENLDRLQSLHHRIHVMLEELNQLNGKKKKGD